MKLKHLLTVAAMAAAMSAVSPAVLAQNDGGPGGGGRRGNFDPAQWREQRMAELRTQMEVKSDDEWKIIEERITKVMDARREAAPPFGFGRGGRRGGDNNDGGGRRGGFFGAPSPELEALNKSIESNAPADQIKAALEKYRASRKAKDAALEKAQADLQKVLTVKQEAIAVANGMLN